MELLMAFQKYISQQVSNQDPLMLTYQQSDTSFVQTVNCNEMSSPACFIQTSTNQFAKILKIKPFSTDGDGNFHPEHLQVFCVLLIWK